MHEAGKIAHVMWEMHIGGAERALYQLVRQQRLCGVQADVLICRQAGYYGEMTRETGARVVELGQKHTNDMSVRSAAEHILADYNIVHFHSAEPGMIRVASGIKHLRRFYTHRSGVFRYRLKQLLRYKVAGYYLRRYFHGISGNTLQGSRAAAGLFGIPVANIPVTYNGIDFSLLDPVRPVRDVLAELNDTAGPDTVRIGVTANLRPWKRIEYLVQAIAGLKDLPVHCYIIGDGPSYGPLQDMARGLGIADRVTFTGKKEHVGDYLQALDIFALPSGPEESFGNSAVESMGTGLPTIVFADGGGLTEHIDEGQTGFIVKDTAELTARLRLLAGNPALRSSIGTQARSVIRERYNLKAMVERYNALYGFTQAAAAPPAGTLVTTG